MNLDNIPIVVSPKIKIEADVDSNTFNFSTHLDSHTMHGRCPLCNRKQGFSFVEAEDMANELYGVVQHIECLVKEAQDSLSKMKAQFKSTIWAKDRWHKSYASRQ